MDVRIAPRSPSMPLGIPCRGLTPWLDNSPSGLQDAAYRSELDVATDLDWGHWCFGDSSLRGPRGCPG